MAYQREREILHKNRGGSGILTCNSHIFVGLGPLTSCSFYSIFPAVFSSAAFISHTFKPSNDYLDSKANTGLEFPLKLSLRLTFKELQQFLNTKFFDSCQLLCMAKIIYSALDHTTTEFARQKYIKSQCPVACLYRSYIS
jgi:hypothetical protein